MTSSDRPLESNVPLLSDGGGDWYFARMGEQVGPVTWPALKALSEDGGLNPRLDLVWNASLTAWTPAGAIDGLFEMGSTVATSAPKPIPPQQQRPVDRAGQTCGLRHYPWAGRSAYLLTALALGLAAYLLELAVDPAFQHFLRTWKGIPDLPSPLKEFGETSFARTIAKILPLTLLIWIRCTRDPDPKPYPYGHVGAVVFVFVSIIVARAILPNSTWLIGSSGVLALLVMVWISARRLVNLGMSRWWVVAYIVPFLNFWLVYRLLACPSGYAISHKLDWIGIVSAILYWLALALGFELAASLAL